MLRFSTRDHPASRSSKRRHFLFLSRSGLATFKFLLTLFEELRQRLWKHASFTRSVLSPPKRFGQRLRVGHNLASWSVDFQPLGAIISILNIVVSESVLSRREPSTGGALAGPGTSSGAGPQVVREECLPNLGPNPYQHRRHHRHQETGDLRDPPPKPQESEKQRPKATAPERDSA